MPTRRQFLTRAAGAGLVGATSGLVGRGPGAAAPSARKFLFVFCKGGWDPTWVFAPMMGNEGVYVEPTATVATAGGLTYVDGENRPAVKAFFEAHADRTAFFNGFEVRSVTHERCRRLLLTGTTQAAADDWASRIAAADPSYLLPHVVISGPVFTSETTSSVLRVGETGQLSDLLDGSVLERAEPPRSPLDDLVTGRIDTFLAAREDRWAAAAGPGRPEVFARDLLRVRDQIDTVLGIEGLDLGITVNGAATPVSDRVEPAIELLARGYARCATVAHLGWFNTTWDNHEDLDQQADHYQTLFTDLDAILQSLASRAGTAGGATLADETVVVVWSEMGRGPVLNSARGKDHWTFTSAMLIGPGVRGGAVIGGYDTSFVGRPLDLTTGELRDDGVRATAENLGATLLALADVDPGALAPVGALLG